MSDYEIIVEILGMTTHFVNRHPKKVVKLASKICAAIASDRELEIEPESVFCFVFPVIVGGFVNDNKTVFVRYSATSSANLDMDWRSGAHIKVGRVFSEIFGDALVPKRIL